VSEAPAGASEDGGAVASCEVGPAVGRGLVAVGVGVGVGVGLEPVSVGVGSAVDDTSEGVGAGGEGELVGVGVGEPVRGPARQNGTPVLVEYGCVGGAGLAVTLVAGAVPDASGAMLAGLGVLITTGSAVGVHLAVDAGCGARVCDFLGTAPVLPWPVLPPLGVAALAVGAPMLLADGVPVPSVAALPRTTSVLPLPLPVHEVLAWRIAWRNG